MEDKTVNSFCLAGGTALSLYLGHRESIDLDFFSLEDFNVADLRNHLEKMYNFQSDFFEKNTLKGNINNVKIEFLTYKYPLVKKINVIDSVRMYSMEDISAMKLSAIADNGTRLKDFVDVAYLSTELSLDEMIQSAKKKFPKVNHLMYEKSLFYHKDINFHTEIKLLDNDFEWENIEKRLDEMGNNADLIFKNKPGNNKGIHL